MWVRLKHFKFSLTLKLIASLGIGKTWEVILLSMSKTGGLLKTATPFSSYCATSFLTDCQLPPWQLYS